MCFGGASIGEAWEGKFVLALGPGLQKRGRGVRGLEEPGKLELRKGLCCVPEMSTNPCLAGIK